MDYNAINNEAAKLYGEDIIENNTEDNKTSPNNKYKKMFVILLVINIIVLLIVLINDLYVPSYEKPIKESIKLINKRNADLNEYYKYMNPFQKFELNSSYYSDYIGNYPPEEYFKMNISSLEKHFGKNYKVTYDIVLIEEVDIEYFDSKSTIVSELPDLELTKAYKLHILISTSGNNNKDTDILETHVLKVNDQWILEFMITPRNVLSSLPLYGLYSD